MNSLRIDSMRFLKWYAAISVFLFFISFNSDAQAFTLKVVDDDGNPITTGFRWLVEEDNTFHVTPGTATPSPGLPESRM